MIGFLGLPPELRIQIYNDLIPPDQHVSYPVPFDGCLSIFQLCRHIRAEASAKLFSDRISVHALLGYGYMNDLIITSWTPYIRRLHIEVGFDALWILEVDHGVSPESKTPSYSAWLSTQATDLAQWIAYFKSLQTLELRLCFTLYHKAIAKDRITELFGKIGTSAEIIVSDGLSSYLGKSACSRIARKLHARRNRALEQSASD
ncbi:hypothetical protein EV356DRAFT_501612 [Viridothelium virens]|uniref:F-box domain-containing protein n=1 Tax=Viridothelium virens TaxID=1048519 RepID=A0A6A6HB30_VIRVR|nr:hypothetical protein EV356DRAFT_501612 [Viridothelium virens]